MGAYHNPLAANFGYFIPNESRHGRVRKGGGGLFSRKKILKIITRLLFEALVYSSRLQG
jgi:hypothetical protein